MCWFAWFTYSDKKLIKNIWTTLNSRAIDKEYFHVENNLSFYHAHLSISDLDKNTSQPLIYKDYIIWLVWEIYNKEYLLNLSWINWSEEEYTELEVIWFAYEKLWEKFINYVNGEFSIFIYDKKTDTYFLYRDRWGTNNTYYRIFNSELFFSSEIKSLIFTEPKVNKEAFIEYMTFQFCIAPNTIVKDINTLRPGTYLKYSNKNLSIHKFEEYKYQENNLSIIDAIKNSVIRRIPKFQKRIFVSLSWWPDSNLILYFLSKYFSWEIIAYSFVTDSNIEEIEYAVKNTNTLWIKHLLIDMNNYKFNFLEDDIYKHEWLVLLPDLWKIILSKYPEYKDIKVEFWGDWKEELILWNDHFPYKDIFSRYKYFKSKSLINDYKINQEFLNKEMFDYNLQYIDKVTLRNWIERRMPYTDYEMLKFHKYKGYKPEVNKFLNDNWLYIVPKEFWYNVWIWFKNLYDNELLQNKNILFKKLKVLS